GGAAAAALVTRPAMARFQRGPRLAHAVAPVPPLLQATGTADAARSLPIRPPRPRPAAGPPVQLGGRGGAVGARDPPPGSGRLRRASVRQGLGAVAAGRHGPAGHRARRTPPACDRTAATAARRDARAASGQSSRRAAVHPLVLLGGRNPARRLPARGLCLRWPAAVPARGLPAAARAPRR